MNTRNILCAGARLAGVLALAATAGCASMTSGDDQVVSVETYSAAGPVSGANCKLQNKKGFYYLTTPGSLRVMRADGDLTVTCDKAGLPTSIVRVKSTLGYTVAGNILFPIGAMVDVASGAAFGYPALLKIMMNPTAAPTPAPALAQVK